MSALAVDKTICQRGQHHSAAHGCVRECTGAAGRGELVISETGVLVGKGKGAAHLHAILLVVDYGKAGRIDVELLNIEDIALAVICVNVHSGSPVAFLGQLEHFAVLYCGGSVSIFLVAVQLYIHFVHVHGISCQEAAVLILPVLDDGQAVGGVGHIQVVGLSAGVEVDLTLGRNLFFLCTLSIVVIISANGSIIGILLVEACTLIDKVVALVATGCIGLRAVAIGYLYLCLLYTSDAADE